jgi:uncharacterized repeat protein (TIGR03803 family)
MLAAGFAMAFVDRVSAQSYTNLHVFSGYYDGAFPKAGLLLLGDRLYGTTRGGGTWGQGVIFAVNVDGTAFTNLHNFAALASPSQTNSDGANPGASLIALGDTFYGTTSFAGTQGRGTIFAIKTNGAGFTNLHNFGDGTDGSSPSRLVLSGNILYGVAQDSGSSRPGMVFAMKIDGTGFTNLHSFNLYDYPRGGLALSGNTLYGVTAFGGTPEKGTIFAINRDGTGFTNLYEFAGNDGDDVQGDLTLSGNILYGTTGRGGVWTKGTVFKINTDGTGFTNLHSFLPTFGDLIKTNNGGAFPLSKLVLSGNVLFGTTISGGNFGEGAVFSMNADGTDFRTLHNFVFSGGTSPNGSLIFSRNALFGTTAVSTFSYGGSLFKLSLPHPRLTVIPAVNNLILQWPANSVGFSLQSTTNLTPPLVWDTVTSEPAIVSGQYTVTNPISGSRKFYRLSQ